MVNSIGVVGADDIVEETFLHLGLFLILSITSRG